VLRIFFTILYRFQLYALSALAGSENFFMLFEIDSQYMPCLPLLPCLPLSAEKIDSCNKLKIKD